MYVISIFLCLSMVYLMAVFFFIYCFFFFKQKTAYEMLRSLVGSGDVYKRQDHRSQAEHRREPRDRPGLPDHVDSDNVGFLQRSGGQEHCRREAEGGNPQGPQGLPVAPPTGREAVDLSVQLFRLPARASEEDLDRMQLYHRGHRGPAVAP